MSSGSAKANEFKRYRQLLTALYIGAISAGFLVLAASVAIELFFRDADQDRPGSEGLVLREGQPDPKSLRRCYHDVASLFQELGHKSTALLARPHLHGKFDSLDLTSEWQTFSASWLKQWEIVGMRCRFAELAEEKLGEAYILMAQLHGALPSLRQHYESLLVAVDRDYLATLTQLAHNLDRANMLLGHSAREEAP